MHISIAGWLDIVMKIVSGRAPILSRFQLLSLPSITNRMHVAFNLYTVTVSRYLGHSLAYEVIHCTIDVFTVGWYEAINEIVSFNEITSSSVHTNKYTI
jgi:hypothetical protein